MQFRIQRRNVMQAMKMEVREEILVKDELDENFQEGESSSTSYIEIPDLVTIVRYENGETILQTLSDSGKQDSSYSISQLKPVSLPGKIPIEMPHLVPISKNQNPPAVVQMFLNPTAQLQPTDVAPTTQNESCLCPVCHLVTKGPNAFTFEEKNALIKAGRATPRLNHSSINSFCRNFSSSLKPLIYKTYPWLTGCQETNKLYCWPCLLFHPVEKSTFLHREFRDISNIHKCLKKHGSLESHLQVYLKERVLANNLAKHDENISTSVQHNDLVVKCRNVLKRLIHIMCFQALYDVTPRGQNGKCNSTYNVRITMDIIKLIAEYDQSLLEEIECISNFKENLPQIYKDLETCLVNITLKEIKNELKEARFASFIFYDILNNRNKNCLAAIVRYIKYVAGKPVTKERFLGYFDIDPSDRTAHNIVKIIKDLIANLDCKEKFVSQSYCGASIVPNQLNIVQSRIKQAFPMAFITYCSGFNLLEIFAQSLSMENQDCKKFFSEVRGISEFFLRYPKLARLLEIAVGTTNFNFPLWEFSKEFFITLKIVLPHMLKIFKEVINGNEFWSPEIVNACRGYVILLEQNRQFKFLLYVFADIFSIFDKLMHKIKLKDSDITTTTDEILEVGKELSKKKSKHMNYVHELILKSQSAVSDNYEPPKKKNCHSPEFKELYEVIMENINNQFRDQLKSYGDLKFTEHCNFKETKFALKDLNQFTVILNNRNYQTIFDNLALLSQFRVLLSSTDVYANKCPEEVLTFLKDTGLDTGFEEVAKLIELVLTIPSYLGSNEKLTSNLRKIKHYVENCADEEMALLAIERRLIQQLFQNPKFLDAVFDEFFSMNDKIQLHFK